METSKIIIGLLVVVILVGGVWWKLSSDSHRQQMVRANNELATLFPLKHINDSLAVRVARVSTDLQAEISKSSQLRKLIKEKEQRILFLAGASTQSRIESVYVAVSFREGFTSYFDTTNRWMELSGQFDSTHIEFTNINIKDSLTLAVTQAENDILYGYIQNHSPYTTVLNADFAIDASQFVDKPSPYWKYLAIGGWSAILIHSLFSLLK